MSKELKNKISNILTGVSIESKIFGMVLIVVLIITTISLIVVRVSMTSTLTDQMEDRAKSVSSDIAARSTDLLLTHNIYGLQSLLSGVLSNYDDIEYIFLLDNKNEVLISSNNERSYTYQLINSNKPLATTTGLKTNNRIINTEKGPIIDAAAPILQDGIGTVRVGLRYDSLKEALNKVTVQMIITMIGVLSLSFIIVYGLTKIITYPITQLMILTKLVAKGDFSRKIKKYPNDEIGKLTAAFNEMVETLSNSEKERKKYILKMQTSNKELSLLNGISNHFEATEEIVIMLNKVVKDMVEQLHLSRVSINVELSGKRKIFEFYQKGCSKCDRGEQCTNLSAHLGFMIKEIFLTGKNDEKIGSMVICTQQELDITTLQILQSLANKLAIAIENYQLWMEVKKKEEIRQKLLKKIITLQEDERMRISRELHDETSHSLSSILIALKVLEENDYQQPYERINQIRTLVQNTLDEVHNLAWQLRPSVLDKFGLKVALERYMEEYYKINGILVDLYFNSNTERFSPEKETTIYRIVQEALTNVSKYAKAKNISVVIITVENSISIVIEDDGVGFDVDKLETKGSTVERLGILGMHERASILGGTLFIESEIGRGTSIHAKIPL